MEVVTMLENVGKAEVAPMDAISTNCFALDGLGTHCLIGQQVYWTL
jgi:hypothetical protein